MRITTALALLFMLLMLGLADAHATTRIEPRTTGPDKTLAYVEPIKVRDGDPQRLYVEFADGSTFVFTPCEFEDSRRCFWWAPTRGNGAGESFIAFRGRTIYL